MNQGESVKWEEKETKNRILENRTLTQRPTSGEAARTTPPCTGSTCMDPMPDLLQKSEGPSVPTIEGLTPGQERKPNRSSQGKIITVETDACGILENNGGGEREAQQRSVELGPDGRKTFIKKRRHESERAFWEMEKIYRGAESVSGRIISWADGRPSPYSYLNKSPRLCPLS